MSKHMRERIDSGSIKKYTKTKSKQQMYSFGNAAGQADNGTRNDIQDIGYKTQQHSPLGHLSGLYAHQVKTHDSHNSKPQLHFQNVNTTQRPGPGGPQPHHERQNSHVVQAARLQSGQQKLAGNKSKKGLVASGGYNQYQHADSSKLQPNNNAINNRVQSPILMNQHQHPVKGAAGSIRSSLNNVGQANSLKNSPPTAIYQDNYGNANYNVVASLIDDSDDLIQQKKFWTQQNSFQNTPRSKKRALQQMGNQRMNPPITKTFYNMTSNQQPKRNQSDSGNGPLECKASIPTQMTMPNHLQNASQIRNIRNTINIKNSNMPAQGSNQLHQNQKVRVHPTNQSIAMKGTPELKAKGIIIANNKQVSNLTNASANAHHHQFKLYENKVNTGGCDSEGTLMGNHLFVNDMQKQKLSMNSKGKAGQSIQQNQWFAQNESHQGSLKHASQQSQSFQHAGSPPQMINPGGVGQMGSPQCYLSQIKSVVPDPNYDSQAASPLVSPSEQNRIRANLSKQGVQQNGSQYNNSKDARNLQGSLTNAQGEYISRNYGQKHPLEVQAHTTGNKQQTTLLNNIGGAQNKATLPHLSLQTSPSNQQKTTAAGFIQHTRQPSSKVRITHKRKTTDPVPIQKAAGIAMRPSDASGPGMASEKSTAFIQMSGAEQASSTHGHVFGPQHAKQASYHHYLAEGKSRQPSGTGNEVQHFVTDSEYLEDSRHVQMSVQQQQQQISNLQQNQHHQSRVSQDLIVNKSNLKSYNQMRPQSKGNSSKVSLQKSRKYATNRQLLKQSDNFVNEQKLNVNQGHTKDGQPMVVQMNLMNGLDSRNLQTSEKNHKANTNLYNKYNSHQISPNRSYGRDDNLRARSHHMSAENHSQSIKSNKNATTIPKGTYDATTNSNHGIYKANAGIQLRKQQQSYPQTGNQNAQSRQRSIIGHHNSPITKNEAAKAINEAKRMQLTEKSANRKSIGHHQNNQGSLQENTQTGSQMDDYDNSFDEHQPVQRHNKGTNQNIDNRQSGRNPREPNSRKEDNKVSMKKETLDELASSRSGASKNSRTSRSGKPCEADNRDKYGMNKMMRDCIVKKYELKSIIGKGSYGCVTKAKCKRTGREVALKVMQQQSQTEYEIIKLLREIQILRRLNEITYELQRNEKNKCSFVPELIEIICPEKRESSSKKSKSGQPKHYDLMNICLVIEFVDTDLDSLLKHKIDFSENHLIKLVYNILCCLAFLHMCNVMHRDLKPANILIQANCSVRVCDFGLSRSMPDSCSNRVQQERIVNQSVCNKTFKNSLYLRQDANEKCEGNEEKQRMYVAEQLIADRERRKTMQRNMSLHVGSRWYRAPEISLVEKQYDFSSDLWSLGCIIHELIQYLQYNKGEHHFKKEFQRLRYLYQGNSCFPLSPCEKNDDEKDKKDGDKSEEKVHVISKDDQNLVILKDLGVQSEQDLSFLTSKHAINYVRELEQSLYGTSVHRMKKISPIEKRADMMAQKLTPVAEEITDIMKNFLQLNPFLRWTAFECIVKCKIFDDVRVRTRELCLKRLHEISLKNYQQKAQKNRVNLKNPKSFGGQQPNVSSVGSSKISSLRGVIYAQGGQNATNSTQDQNRQNQESVSADDQAIFKKSNVNSNCKDIDYHIELLIDSADAFDYEDLKNAKYSIDDLKDMLREQILCFENNSSQ